MACHITLDFLHEEVVRLCYVVQKRLNVKLLLRCPIGLARVVLESVARAQAPMRDGFPKQHDWKCSTNDDICI